MSKLDEISQLLGSIETIHCSNGHSHTDETPFRIRMSGWFIHDVSEVFGTSITPCASSMFDYVNVEIGTSVVIECSACGDRFDVPEKAEVLWP